MHHFNFGSGGFGAFGGGSGAAPLRGSHHLPHFSSSANMHSQAQNKQQQRQPRPHARLRVAAAAAAAATAGAAGMHMYRQGQLSLPFSKQQEAGQQKFLIPRELAEVMAGAFAEIVQVAALYPIDTIKVRCQASGMPMSVVIRQLMASPATTLAQLYAGVVSASVASVAVGSLYFFTFCSAKRTATRLVADAEAKFNAAKTTAAGGPAIAAVTAGAAGHSHSSSSNSAADSHIYPHGAAADYHHDAVFAAICSIDQQAKLDSSSSSSVDDGSSSRSEAKAAAELSSNGRLQANLLAACAAAVVGALIEAPVELFKHRAQVGQIQGSMLGAMFKALKQQGPRALYGSFFLPFCFKSLPFDIGELLTYASLNDWKDRQLAAAPSAAAAAPSPAAARPVAAPAAAAAAAWDDAEAPQQQQQQAALAFGSITATITDMGAITLTTAAAGSSSSSSSSGQSKVQQLLANTPDHVWDMAAGAAAGAAAVLVSMPPDCVKTVLETGGGVAVKPGSGVFGSVGAFAATTRQLVQQRGVAGGLFCGMGPRLMESVPSTMLYWMAVEGARRVLEPYTAK